MQAVKDKKSEKGNNEEKKDKMVSFILPHELRVKLTKRFKKDGVSKSRQIRDALEAYFDKLED